MKAFIITYSLASQIGDLAIRLRWIFIFLIALDAIGVIGLEPTFLAYVSTSEYFLQIFIENNPTIKD